MNIAQSIQADIEPRRIAELRQTLAQEREKQEREKREREAQQQHPDQAGKLQESTAR